MRRHRDDRPLRVNQDEAFAVVVQIKLWVKGVSDGTVLASFGFSFGNVAIIVVTIVTILVTVYIPTEQLVQIDGGVAGRVVETVIIVVGIRTEANLRF